MNDNSNIDVFVVVYGEVRRRILDGQRYVIVSGFSSLIWMTNRYLIYLTPDPIESIGGPQELRDVLGRAVHSKCPDAKITQAVIIPINFNKSITEKSIYGVEVIYPANWPVVLKDIEEIALKVFGPSV